MRRLTLLLAVLSIFFCSCIIFRGSSKGKQPSQPTVKVEADSIALKVRLNGEDVRLLSSSLEDVLFSALRARGFSVVKGLGQPTELVLDADLQLKEGKRKRMYGPDKFTYRVEGVWKLLKRGESVLILDKGLSKEATGLGRETAVRAVVQMTASEIARTVSETVSRPMGSPRPPKVR